MQPADFLIKYEGFAPRAIWDVNAWRIGYGSDTHTDALGNVRKVQQGDTTTPADARRDLDRRINKEFIPKIINKIGADTWEAMPNNTRTALVSIAYNYGNVPKQAIIDAARSRDLSRLAKVWTESTYNDNKKLPENVRNALRKRRAKEAELIAIDATTTDGGISNTTKIAALALIAGGIALLTA
jgi:GH24 family phage-related lysozyme (muramidase)